MNKKWIFAGVLVVQAAVLAPAAAQTTKPMTPEQQKQEREKELADPENYLRPTEPLKPLNMDYFVGTWNFEWDVPDTDLGPAGRITGTEVVKPGVDGKFYESEITADGAWGPFKANAIYNYNEGAKAVAWYQSNSLGMAQLLLGRINTDSGIYMISFEGAEFTYKGHKVKMKAVASLTSPVAMRTRYTVSIDGAGFMNFGNPWWRKDPSKSPPPPTFR